MRERLIDTPGEQGCGCAVTFVLVGVGGVLLRLLGVATGSDTSGVLLNLVFPVSLALIVWPLYAALLLVLGGALGERRDSLAGRRQLDPIRLWSGPMVGVVGVALSVASLISERQGLVVGAVVLILLWMLVTSLRWRRRRMADT